MGLTIWKFSAPITDRFQLVMPIGAKLLSVQLQNGDPQIWALVDPHADVERRTFAWVGTGLPVPVKAERAIFVGTVQLPSGLVFHLFGSP